MIEIREVEKVFGSARTKPVVALEAIDLTIAEGEFVSIVGPSGCGKSTLLRIVAGLEVPTTGTTALATVDPAARNIGFVFQDPVLLPWLTVLQNVRFPLDTAGVDRVGADRIAGDLIRLVGLQGFENALPGQLSGGMRQRTSIARALSYDPPVLLMDEPFGALDLLTRDRLNDELLHIWEKTGKTVLFVTHSVEEAVYLSDRIAVMSPRPGRIERIYDVPFGRPRTEETKLDPRFSRLMADLRRDLR